eukprot:2176419-Amphidinium_carterae.1
MLESFGCHAMQGLRLDTFVDPSDQLALRQFLGVLGNEQPDPILITCSSNASQFDVRLVPYKMNGSTMGFCVQMVGEAQQLRS